MSLQVQLIIIGWKTYEISHDPLLLGLIGLTEAIPAIGFSFIAGHIVDQGRPATIYFRSLFALLVNAGFTLLVVSPRLDFSPATRLSLLLCAMFTLGIFKAFIGPSIFSILPHAVQRSQLSSAMAWNNSSFHLASVAGPALGGLVYGVYGARVAFAIPVVVLVAALISCSRFSPAIRDLRNDRHRESLLAGFKVAVSFIRDHKVLSSTMTLDLLAVLFGGVTALLPLFADQVLSTDASGLGLLRAASAAGSAGVGIYFAKRPLRIISGNRLLLSVMAFGGATIAFALSRNFLLSLLLLVLVGAFDGVSSLLRATLLQTQTPPAMRGRISALNSIFVTSSNEIGSFESGVAAKFMGLIPSVVFGGSMTLVVSLWVRARSLELRNFVLNVDP